MKKTGEQKIKSIAIQGGHGAYHEMAARHYFPDEKINIVPCDTFNSLFDVLKNKKADYGIMAIENSIAGTILPNYTLLRDSKLKIAGEIYMRIKHNLLALPGQTIYDLKEVHSHPMALLQCQKFFEKHPHIRLVESPDTALSAKEIKEKQLKGSGAIAGYLAAKLYELEILYKGIETNKKNYTRFLLVSDNDHAALIRKNDNTILNKSSLCFELPHEQGSLSKVLAILAFYNINLTKIQSIPIPGKEWEYLFYIDLMFDDYIRYRQSLDAIIPLSSNLEILGEYTKGHKIFDNKKIKHEVNVCY